MKRVFAITLIIMASTVLSLGQETGGKGKEGARPRGSQIADAIIAKEKQITEALIKKDQKSFDSLVASDAF